MSSLTWRGKPLPWKSFSRECKKGRWRRLQSGLTCAPSIARNGVALWTWSLRDFRASRCRSQASDLASRTRAGSGTTCGESLATWEPTTCSWRTCPGSSRRGSRRSSATWPRAGGLRSGTAFLRQPSAPLTAETASSSLLPTPAAQSYGSNRGGAAGRVGPVRHSLESLAKQGLLPTPTAGDAKESGAAGYSTERRHSGTTLTDAPVRRLPTPGGRDWKVQGKDGLELRLAGRTDRRLNPRFVEWMMGFPDRWTETVSTSSGTP